MTNINLLYSEDERNSYYQSLPASTRLAIHKMSKKLSRKAKPFYTLGFMERYSGGGRKLDSIDNSHVALILNRFGFHKFSDLLRT